jgi:hypothetical protein
MWTGFHKKIQPNRHNNYFHFGKGIIVCFLEYVIVRINDQFLPSVTPDNNTSTRIIKKWWHNNDNNSSPFTGNNYNNNSLHSGGNGYDCGFTIIPDQIGNPLGCGTVGQLVKSNNNVKIFQKWHHHITSIRYWNHHHHYLTNQLIQTV